MFSLKKLFLSGLLVLLSVGSWGCRALEEDIAISPRDDGSFEVEIVSKLRWEKRSTYTREDIEARDRAERLHREGADAWALRLRDSAALNISVQSEEAMHEGRMHIVHIRRRAELMSTDQLNRLFADEALTFKFTSDENRRTLEVFVPRPELTADESELLRAFKDVFVKDATEFLLQVDWLYDYLENYPGRRDGFRPFFSSSGEPKQFPDKWKKSLIKRERVWLKSYQKAFAPLGKLFDVNKETEAALAKLSGHSRAISIYPPSDDLSALEGFQVQRNDDGAIGALGLNTPLPQELLIHLLESRFEPGFEEVEGLYSDTPLEVLPFKSTLPESDEVIKILEKCFEFVGYYRMGWTYTH